MKFTFKTYISVLLISLLVIALVNIVKQQTIVEERLNKYQQAAIEEPKEIKGKWQIIMFQGRLFPPPIIKTSCYYAKDKMLWYKDEVTGEELPVPADAMILPDDGRDLEAYGVYDINIDYN
jgi:hypothetical protein